MTPISVNTIRKAVISKLSSQFPFPEYRIYGEEIAQGFQAPCFFVKLFPVEQTQEIGKRYFRKHLFNIHYFHASDYANDEMHEMAEKLYELMEYVDVGTLIRGTKMKHEIHNGVLHFFVEYNFHVQKHVDEIKMRTLEVIEFDTRDNRQSDDGEATE